MALSLPITIAIILSLIMLNAIMLSDVASKFYVNLIDKTMKRNKLERFSLETFFHTRLVLWSLPECSPVRLLHAVIWLACNTS
jgi:hypothetical protein